MKMNVKFESREELLSFVGMFGATKFTPEQGQAIQINVEKPKEVVKAEKSKEKKGTVTPEAKKEEPIKEDPAKVDAEVTGIDTTTTEPPKDVEVKEPEVTNITKEMVRVKFNAVVASGKQKEAKQLIENLKVKKLSDVKPEDYATLIKDAEALL